MKGERIKCPRGLARVEVEGSLGINSVPAFGRTKQKQLALQDSLVFFFVQIKKSIKLAVH